MRKDNNDKSLTNLTQLSKNGESKPAMSLDDAMADLSNEIAEKEATRIENEKETSNIVEKEISSIVKNPIVEQSETSELENTETNGTLDSRYKLPKKMYQNVPDVTNDPDGAKFGSIIEQARQRKLEKENAKIANSQSPSNETGEYVEKDGYKYKDTYIDEDEIIEKEQKEREIEKSKKQTPLIKIDGIEMDLSQITKVRVSKDGKNYEKNRHRRLEARKTYQVVVPISGYSANMLSMSSSEIINLSSLNVDAYRRTKAHLTTLYNKMVDPIVPMSWDDFIKCTSMFEQNILWFGIFSNTYPGVNEYRAKCEGMFGDKPCENSYKFYMKNSDFIDIPDGTTHKAIVNVIENAVNAKELLTKSRVNEVERVWCPNAQIAVDVRVPSLYNFLEDTLNNMKNINQNTLDDVIIEFMPFIESVYVYDGDGAFLEIIDFDKKYQELYDLNDDDLKLVADTMNEIIKDLPRLEYSFKIPACPKCGKVPTEEQTRITNVASLVFTTHRLKAGTE